MPELLMESMAEMLLMIHVLQSNEHNVIDANTERTLHGGMASWGLYRPKLLY